MLIFRSLIVLIVLGLFAPAAMALTSDGAVRVVDGDTLVWQGKPVRLFGIDAPERDQRCDRGGTAWACGAWATDQLRAAVRAGPVDCRAEDTDRYGRLVATCTANGVDLARFQVQSGAALAYLRYTSRYARDEARAKAASVGLWSGSMVTPQAHRQAQRAPARDPAPTGCAIKGNISGSNRIYHSPGQRDYDNTRINPDRGERWFCSAAEARAAGFRPARR
jgi:endonuclease YncB( thermonuclease family)